MFRKILIGSDGSESALAAARMAAQIAGKFQSAVTLVYAYPLEAVASPALTAGVWEIAVSPGAEDAYIAQARQTLQTLTESLFAPAGVACESLLECGHPVEVITRIAKEREADLIIVGNRGLSGVSEFLMGSVSEGVLHQAHCSVLITRGEAAEGGAMGRVLLAADASEGARCAEETAVALATNFHAALTVLTVTEKPGLLAEAAAAYDESSAEDYKNRAADALDQSVGKASEEAGVSTAMRRETGHPAQTILRVAAEEASDLILLGSRGLGTFKALLLGSVSNRVAHYAKCSVLVAR